MGMVIIAVVVAATTSPSMVITGPIIVPMLRPTGTEPQPAASVVVSGRVVAAMSRAARAQFAAMRVMVTRQVVTAVSWAAGAELAAVGIIIVLVVVVTTSPAPVIVTRRIISTVPRTTGAEPLAPVVVARSRSRRCRDDDAVGRARVVGAVPGAGLGDEEGEG